MHLERDARTNQRSHAVALLTVSSSYRGVRASCGAAVGLSPDQTDRPRLWSVLQTHYSAQKLNDCDENPIASVIAAFLNLTDASSPSLRLKITKRLDNWLQDDFCSEHNSNFMTFKNLFRSLFKGIAHQKMSLCWKCTRAIRCRWVYFFIRFRGM